MTLLYYYSCECELRCFVHFAQCAVVVQLELLQVEENDICEVRKKIRFSENLLFTVFFCVVVFDLLRLQENVERLSYRLLQSATRSWMSSKESVFVFFMPNAGN